MESPDGSMPCKDGNRHFGQQQDQAGPETEGSQYN